jgi:hypothetical protein
LITFLATSHADSCEVGACSGIGILALLLVYPGSTLIR